MPVQFQVTIFDLSNGKSVIVCKFDRLGIFLS